MVILIIVSKSCSTIEIKPNISNPQSTLTTDENKYLELLMHKIYTKYSEASISIMVEGQQGIDKINFINSIINKLYEQKREVIEVEIDISESENVDNVIQNFSDKLQFKLKEKKFYLGESKRFKKIFPEISTKFSLPVNKSIIQEIVDKIFEDTSKLTIQEILSNLSKSEYLFVTITGINIENVETAYRSIKKLKKLLCYPRNIIVTVWDTEIFEKLSGECKLKLDESDILKIFDETIHLTSRSFEVIFEEFQKNDEGMWKIYDNFSINIITEYKKMTRDMDIDLKYTYSTMDLDYQKAQKRFCECRELLNQKLKNPITAQSLYNDLLYSVTPLKEYPIEKRKKFFEEYNCFQSLLILNIIRDLCPKEYREIEKKGLEQYINMQNWETNDIIIFGLLYLLKKANSLSLKRKKEFMIAFLEKKLEELYLKSQYNFEQYKIFLKDKKYEHINIGDMLYHVVLNNASEFNKENSNIIQNLLLIVLPWQMHNLNLNKNFPFKLLLDVFDRYDLADYITPDLRFWSSFNKFLRHEKCHLADLCYAESLQMKIVESYVPLSFQYFKDLFNYNKLEEFQEYNNEEENIPISIAENKFNNLIEAFILRYKPNFPDMDSHNSSMITLKAILILCEKNLKNYCKVGDSKCNDTIDAAKTQWEELKNLKEILDYILFPEIQKLIKQQTFSELSDAIWKITLKKNTYSSKEKGQIASLIEKEFKSYNITSQSKDKKEKMLKAIIEFERVFNEDLRELKISLT